ncbi:MAG: DUF2764 family protein [Bacteroidota bacterium]
MSYYYLIAGLPELTLESNLKKMDCDELFETIKRNLEPSDWQTLKYLIYPIDNRNLLTVLFLKYKNFSISPFLTPSIFSEEEMNEYHKHKSAFPDYMEEYLKLNEDQFPTMSPREMEAKLWDMFYEEMSSQDQFVIDYYHFENRLKETIAAYNSDYFSFLGEPSLTDYTLLGQLGKGKTVSTTLLREYPYVEELGEKIHTSDPLSLERFIDRIKWDYLDEVKGYFERDQVFVYALRLLMIKRWQTLELEKEEQRFNAIHKTIKESFNSKFLQHG